MIECKNLIKLYNDGNKEHMVLKGVNLKLKEQDIITIMGKSGSGKSTLLNCLSLLTPHTEGEILINGELVNKESKNSENIRQEKFGIVFQNPSLLPSLTVMENLIIAIHGKEKFRVKEEKVMNLLNQVHMGIKRNQEAGTLSGGEQQRIAILRALINKPEIIFCDEPTGALDEETGNEIMQFLLEMCKLYKTSLLMVTHDSTLGAIGKKQYRMEEGLLYEI